MALSSARGKLIGVIGDEDTCVGFLLGGVGELNKNRQPNFMVVDKNTAVSDIEETLKGFIRRSDIDIILINQNVAEMVGLTRYFFPVKAWFIDFRCLKGCRAFAVN